MGREGFSGYLRLAIIALRSHLVVVRDLWLSLRAGGTEGGSAGSVCDYDAVASLRGGWQSAAGGQCDAMWTSGMQLQNAPPTGSACKCVRVCARVSVCMLRACCADLFARVELCV